MLYPWLSVCPALRPFALLPKGITSLVFCCLLWIGLAQPLQAATLDPAINSNLEAQVLQIIRNHPEVIIESVQAYQKQQQEEVRRNRQSLVQQLQANPGAAIGNSPRTGSSQAKMVLLEFSDFQCPYCAQTVVMLKEFMQKYGNQVALVYKHYPLVSIHPQALPAAKAAWAAAQQGKFWPYHDALFAQQQELGEDLFLKIAQELQLDVSRFNRDRQSQAATTAIEQDMKMGEALGIEGTPFLVLNGRLFNGAPPLEELEKALQP